MPDLWSYALVSLVIVLASAAMIGWHMRAWREAQRRPLEPVDYDFHRRQFRRRMQSSAMLGILGIGIFAGGLLMFLRVGPLVVTAYWLAVLVVLGWVALLAVGDAIATRFHYGRLRDQCLIEQTRLQAELRRLQSTRGNGRPAGKRSVND